MPTRIGITQSPSGIILLKSKDDSDLIGISPDRIMVRNHPRESVCIPFLFALNSFANPNTRD